MQEVNKGKILLKAAIPALIAVAKELPIIGTPLRLSMAFHKIWAEQLQAAQDVLPESERPEQLQQAAALRPSEARALALEALTEETQGQKLDQEQREAVADVVAMIPARIQERTHATLMQAKRYGTVAQEVLPLSAKASTSEREEFYSSLLPASRPQFRPGDALPHGNPEWRLVELIGTGGFGEVWRSQHDYLGEERAVKFCQNEVGSAILQREAANLYRLRQALPNHPHIVRLYDLQLKHQPFWLTFEYVSGGTLESLVRARGIIPWQEALRIIYPVWHAMTQVHALEIVHRDLKPANILFSAKNVPKIADFGIGKVLAEQVEATGAPSRRSQGMTTRGYGSAGYMSPEQEEGEAAHPADDTYALTIILWQMLSGNLGRTPRFPKDIQMLNIPEILKKIIGACRFLPREQRPSDAQVLPHLQQLLQTETSRPTAQPVAVAPVTEPVPEPVPEIVQEPLEPETVAPSMPSLVRKIQPQDKLDAPIAALQIEPIAPPQPAPVVESLSLAQPTNDAASIDDEVEENVDTEDESAEDATDTSSKPPLTTIVAQTEAHDHYLIHDDGTVTDTRTGLMWKRCVEGQIWNGKTCKKKESRITWNDCMPDGKQKSWPEFAGYTDWRLPTREELRTLVYCSSGQPQTWHNKGVKPCAGEFQKPTIDHIAFPNTPLSTFWTASTSSDKSARQVSFKLGCQYGVILSSPARVRLVRGTVLGATTESVPNDVKLEEAIVLTESIATEPPVAVTELSPPSSLELPTPSPAAVTESLPALSAEPQIPALVSDMSQYPQTDDSLISTNATDTDADTNGGREQYAMIAMLDLALYGENKSTTLANLSTHQDISLSYLEQLFAALRTKKLVQGIRGPGGGYTLAKTAKDISIAEIICAIDGWPGFVQCGDKEYCQPDQKSADILWHNFRIELFEFLNNIHLADLIARRANKDRSDTTSPTELIAPPEPVTVTESLAPLSAELPTPPLASDVSQESQQEQPDTSVAKPQDDGQEMEVIAEPQTPPLVAEMPQYVQHEHYLLHPNGTVTDVSTNLMWKRCAEGQEWDEENCIGEATKMTWDQIMPDDKQKSWPAFAEYNDWRVPTINELTSLIYCSSGDPKTWNNTGRECKGEYAKPTIDQIAFPNTPTTWFWSTTSVKDMYLLVVFGLGLVRRINKYGSYAVRLVRDIEKKTKPDNTRKKSRTNDTNIDEISPKTSSASSIDEISPETSLASSIDEISPETSSASSIGKDIEQKLREDSRIQRLLRNERWCDVANAAIAYYCHNTACPNTNLEKSLSWQQIGMIYKETYTKHIEQKLREDSRVQRLLRHERLRATADAAIAYHCHNVACPIKNWEKSSTWQQVESVYKEFMN